MLDKVLSVLEDKLVTNIDIVDFKQSNPFYDFFVIGEISSSRQSNAVVDSIKKEFEVLNVDGNANSGWIAIELEHLVIHIFDKETRDYYELDKLFYQYLKVRENV